MTRIYGGPASGTPQVDWSITDDGNGLLTGSLRIFIDSKGSGATISGGSSPSGAGSLFDIYQGNNGLNGFDKYSGNNGLSNPASGPSSGGSIAPDVPKKGDKHPYDERLVCYGATVTYGRMGIAYADAQYVGLLNDPAGFEWELSCPTEEEPIELHPSFYETEGKTVNASTGESEKVGDRDIKYIESFGVVTQKGTDPKTNSPYWDLEHVDIDFKSRRFEKFKPSQEMIDKRLVGVESFKVPRPTFKLSYSTMTTGTWAWMVSQVGKRAQKIPYTENLVDIPSGMGQGGNQNWLLGSVNVTRTNGIYKVSTDWILSGRYGWNEIIYEEFKDESGDSSSATASDK